MDNLKCNRLTCRKALAEKAVVTTCSHIFCVECANELFNASRLCPACDTSLTEPDDVVVCSLNPTNDYKTSVLSGLNPTIILEICNRAMSFWQYQLHQEHSFQQAVIRNVNEKNAQMQKELHNVVREANGEISILNNKITELQRELEMEKRKSITLQESVKEREKEYQKLKAQYDKVKRKAILAPDNPVTASSSRNSFIPEDNSLNRIASVATSNAPIDVGAVVGSMEANGIQRTPINNRTMQHHMTTSTSWRPSGPQPRLHAQAHRQPFNANTLNHSFRSGTGSEQSDSANEVETMIGTRPVRRASADGVSSWGASRGQQNRPVPRPFPQGFPKRSGTFKPAVVPG